MSIINQSNLFIVEKKLSLLEMRFKNSCRQFNYYKIKCIILLDDNDKRFMKNLMKRYVLTYDEGTKNLTLYIPISIVIKWLSHPLIGMELDQVFLDAAREAMFDY